MVGDGWRWSAVASGGLAAVRVGRWWSGGGSAVDGGNRGNLIFPHGKIFPCHGNTTIPCMR